MAQVTSTLWDLKPDAPAEFRGEFRPIATNVPGIRIGEHLPRLARQAHKFCLIRSMTHPHPRHGWGLYYMLTGQRHNRPDLDAPPTPDDFPGLNTLKYKLLPRADQASSALLEDLHGRGLLESTLVLVMGEFGRTPRIGQVVMNGATDRAGRDHWPHAYTVLAAGGGVRGGQIYGASDNRAAYVLDAPVAPPDLQATALHALGIALATSIIDRQGRPHPVIDGLPVVGHF